MTKMSHLPAFPWLLHTLFRVMYTFELDMHASTEWLGKHIQTKIYAIYAHWKNMPVSTYLQKSKNESI